MVFHGIIYKITNLINSKIYIGQTVQSLHKRWKQHVYNTSRDCDNTINKAIRKYGIESFKIEEIDGANSLSELNYKEWLLIFKFNSQNRDTGYNTKEGGRNVKITKETRRIISTAQLERLRRSFSVYHKQTRDLIGTWDNITTCSEFLKLNKTCIGNCLNNRHLCHMNYVFCFLDQDVSKVFEKIKPSFIASKNAETIGIFHKQSDCANEIKIDVRYINKCLNGKSTSYKEYKFKYIW